MYIIQRQATSQGYIPWLCICDETYNNIDGTVNLINLFLGVVVMFTSSQSFYRNLND